MNLTNLKQYVESAAESIEEIRNEINIAETKNVFAYPRSKNIRRAALELAKYGKFVREECLTVFKEGEESK